MTLAKGVNLPTEEPLWNRSRVRPGSDLGQPHVENSSSSMESLLHTIRAFVKDHGVNAKQGKQGLRRRLPDSLLHSENSGFPLGVVKTECLW
ncbi:hypothetical protein ANANG_G00162530 [Anguilla anguilla]|uniref:Uncharacterized protein n=1 Tax=Anguilla anguilla TaxID=7936 RepID=A0A9D3RUW6_ANGAN|nr:hypothetical protein ANANG_G00162530 [Anguilla anguilla]